MAKQTMEKARRIHPQTKFIPALAMDVFVCTATTRDNIVTQKRVMIRSSTTTHVIQKERCCLVVFI